MNKKIWLVTLCVVVIGAGLGFTFFLIISNGKNADEMTNMSESMEAIDRGDESAISDDKIVFENIDIAYSLPEDFYFEYENTEIEHGIDKSYMDHNFNRMIDIYIYETYVGDVGIIGDTVEESYVYKNITIDADEWLREMEMVYLETDDISLIKEEKVNERSAKYIVKYRPNDDGIMQGTLVGMIPVDDEHFYAVHVVEFDQDTEPEFNDYKCLFDINIK